MAEMHGGMRFVELFAGIGGMGAGFRAVGGKCVFATDSNKFAMDTYQANNPNVPVHVGDIRKLGSSAIPDHDVLLAGFPCPPFSTMGIAVRRHLGTSIGMDSKEGNLFFEAARIINTHRPRFVVMENVKNFAFFENGCVLRRVYDTLSDMDYSISYRILNAAAWVPQYRSRIFIVAIHNGSECDLSTIPVPEKDKWPVLSTILHQSGKEAAEPPYTKGSPLQVSDKYTLSDKRWQFIQNRKRNNTNNKNRLPHIVQLVGPEDHSQALTTSCKHTLIKQYRSNPRYLTPRECARLMGFDSSRTPSFIIPMSDTQAYKQLGNSVVVPVIKEIAEIIKGRFTTGKLHGYGSLKSRPDLFAIFRRAKELKNS